MLLCNTLQRTDRTTLLALLVQGASDFRDRKCMAAVRALVEIIAAMADRVSASGSLQLRRDFAADAPAEVFHRLRRFDPTRAGFRSWCSLVLRGLWIDRWRRWRRERARRVSWDALPCEPCLEDAPAPADGLAAQEMLPPRDLKHFARQWNPHDRILLLCLSGLWVRVPAEPWDRWLREAAIDGPFPPAGFLDARNLSEGCAALAGPMGVKARTLMRQWFRKRAELAAVHSVKACLS